MSSVFGTRRMEQQCLAEAPRVTHRACEPYRQFGRACHRAGASCRPPAGLRRHAVAHRTLVCLTRELRAHLAQARHGCDCETIQVFAFDSHIRCYTQKTLSACKLPLSDLSMIYRIVDFADLLDPAGSRQALGITLSCIWQNGNAEARPDIPTR